MNVVLPEQRELTILSQGIHAAHVTEAGSEGYAAAIDLGTTTLCCYLLDASDGKEIASASAPNPQRVSGADVVTRLSLAFRGHLGFLSQMVREEISDLLLRCCRERGISPREIRYICPVGNPAMQQIFLGMPVDNLIHIPFHAKLTGTQITDAGSYLPDFPRSKLIIVPNISAYVGSDTIGCILAAQMHRRQETILLVDIGTNGEMVLSHQGKLICCATAAGPALEGAQISQGLTARTGAIDRVWVENESLHCHVIGGGAPTGICGSGLIDAAAAALDLGLVNSRGKILRGNISLDGGIRLTQEDIRQLQLAKGAIRAGIDMLCLHANIHFSQIHRVLLAGAFGTFLNPVSACRIHMLPWEFINKTTPIGNAAGSGAKMLCCSQQLRNEADVLARQVQYLELTREKAFPKAFAQAMRFPVSREIQENAE